MSLIIFLALCILGLDFMIYVLFKLFYGDRRRAIAREVAAHRSAFNQKPPKPFLVSSRKAAPAILPGGTGANVRRLNPVPDRHLVRNAS